MFRENWKHYLAGLILIVAAVLLPQVLIIGESVDMVVPTEESITVGPYDQLLVPAGQVTLTSLKPFSVTSPVTQTATNVGGQYYLVVTNNDAAKILLDGQDTIGVSVHTEIPANMIEVTVRSHAPMLVVRAILILVAMVLTVGKYLMSKSSDDDWG